MTEFKVGDKVKFNGKKTQFDLQLQRDKIYTIEESSQTIHSPPFYFIRITQPELRHIYYSSHIFELVEEEKMEEFKVILEEII